MVKTGQSDYVAPRLTYENIRKGDTTLLTTGIEMRKPHFLPKFKSMYRHPIPEYEASSIMTSIDPDALSALM